MRIAFVTSGGVPNPSTEGGLVTVWTTMRHLLERGHEVTGICLYAQPYLDAMGVSAEERLEALEQLGVRPVPLQLGPGRSTRSRREVAARIVAPRPDDLYPTLLACDQVADAVRASGAETLFAYHFEGVAASSAVDIPRLGAVGDPSHLPLVYRWRLLERKGLDRRALRRAAEVAGAVWHLRRLMPRLLAGCAATGAFAAHHAAWLRRRGVRGCEYLRTPIPDPHPEGRPPAPGRAAGRPRILHLGHLRGTVTVDGLLLLGREVLPRLEAELGPDGFVLDMVGGFDPPDEVRSLLDRPAVRYTGHVADPAGAFRDADAFVVPASIPLGIRIRALTAFSFGAAIVAHRSNALGIPELAHGRNAFLAGSGKELAAGLLAVLRDPGLRERLGRGGRETYERWFAPPAAAGRIEDILRGIAA